MATGRPATAEFHETGMIHTADEKMSEAARCRSLVLCVTTEAEIGVANHQHLGVDRAMRVMTDGAAFPQGRVFENERPGLIAVALGASFVQPGHGETMRRFHDVLAVRIVTLNAVHFAFNYRMMLRQVEFRIDLNVALKTGFRALAGIDDEFPPSASNRNMFAGRAMARFTALHPRQLGVVQAQSGMRAGWKCVADGRMTLQANLVAKISGTFNIWWCHYCSRSGGAGIEQQGEHPGTQHHTRQPTPMLLGPSVRSKARFESGHLKL